MESRKVVQVLFDAYVPVNGRSSLQQLVSGQQVVSIFRTGDEVGFETFHRETFYVPFSRVVRIQYEDGLKTSAPSVAGSGDPPSPYGGATVRETPIRPAKKVRRRRKQAKGGGVQSSSGKELRDKPAGAEDSDAVPGRAGAGDNADQAAG